MRCGNALVRTCVKCGTQSASATNFCGKCGMPLNETAASPTNKARGALSGERRHLTVLFCDLVGSTEIAAGLDPEEWRETVASYRTAASEAISRFGGHVAQYLGDGVMAYFGWPAAHDNDAERAARAGLSILDAIARLNVQPSGAKLSGRVGLDSGTVVVGAGAGKDADVFGDVPNIAARVQAAADPDTVLITAATHRLISGLFDVQKTGARKLKGVPSAIDLFRVVRPTGVRGRLGAARGLTRFVGREDELRLLLSRWESACKGEGQLVSVIGEAGIGKSRLVAEFHERIRGTPHIWMESAGEQLFENTPFHAVSAMLSQWMELQGGATSGEQASRLERALASTGLEPKEAAPLIGDLLQLPVSERYEGPSFTPEQKRRRLLAVLTRWILGAAQLQPLVMVVEDLHWLDPSTRELQQSLVELGAGAPLMLLCTARPEFRYSWPLRSHHIQITLSQLNGRDVEEMIVQMTARHALTPETLHLVIERASGVPLFIEELTRAVLETGEAKPGTRAIPETLHDSLMARLDRLGTAREIAQLAAVIGAEFSYELLQAVSTRTEDELRAALSKLSDADLVYARGTPPTATYRFKHALIKDAAYDALLRSRRRELHRLVARTIEEKFALIKETYPGVLAHHWSEAGETGLAITQWSMAGKAAEARSALDEAEESYRQALVLLGLLPESPERDTRELRLRQSLVSMLHLTRGWTAPETVAATKRLEMLAKNSGNIRQLVGSMTTRCLHAYIAGELRAAGALADQALQLAQSECNATGLAYLHMLEVGTRYHRGDLAGAEKQFTEGLTFFDDQRFREDPNGGPIAVFGAAALNAWMLGRAEVARERIAKVKTGGNWAKLHDVTHSDWYAALLHTLMRESEQAEILAARGLELCEKHKFPNVAAYLRCILGEITGSIELIRRGIAELLQMGSRIAITSCVTALAAAQHRAGALDDAVQTVEHALEINPDELIYRPETLRVRGELRLALGQVDQAEADFRDSIAFAQKIGAKAWELRTSVSLARLLRSQRRRSEAHNMMSEIYNWFTEGFDTADLVEAKCLLEELEAAS
jgi:class 3 adenylate cyclase/tetratricopeptide (TPR) repeat protein